MYRATQYNSGPLKEDLKFSIIMCTRISLSLYCTCGQNSIILAAACLCMHEQLCQTTMDIVTVKTCSGQLVYKKVACFQTLTCAPMTREPGNEKGY